jgi:hypothetical protein
MSHGSSDGFSMCIVCYKTSGVNQQMAVTCMPLNLLRCHTEYSINTLCWRVTRWRSWLRHCATSWKVVGLIPDGVIGYFSLT